MGVTVVHADVHRGKAALLALPCWVPCMYKVYDGDRCWMAIIFQLPCAVIDVVIIIVKLQSACRCFYLAFLSLLS
jgi:hypothetical protein